MSYHGNLLPPVGAGKTQHVSYIRDLSGVAQIFLRNIFRTQGIAEHEHCFCEFTWLRVKNIYGHTPVFI